DRQRRGSSLAVPYYIEVVVERRNFIHLGLRQAHLVGQRTHVERVDAAVAVLNEVQMLDQQVAAPFSLPKQRADLCAGYWGDGTSVRPAVAPPASRLSCHGGLCATSN